MKILQFKHLSNYKNIIKKVSVKIEQTIDANGPIEGVQVTRPAQVTSCGGPAGQVLQGGTSTD